MVLWLDGFLVEFVCMYLYTHPRNHQRQRGFGKRDIFFNALTFVKEFFC